MRMWSNFITIVDNANLIMEVEFAADGLDERQLLISIPLNGILLKTKMEMICTTRV
jgi:hypothetical protein